MINYAKHDEDFYGIFKLINGDEVIGKAVMHEEDGESLAFIQDALQVEVFTRQIDEGKVAKGIGLAPWMQMADEEFVIVREKDIMAMSTMSKQHVLLYEAFLAQEFTNGNRRPNKRIKLEKEMGYLGKIEDARKLFKKIYNFPSNPDSVESTGD